MRQSFDKAFKQCDVRGLYPDEVNEELAYRLGRAVATLASERRVVAAGDVRLSTQALKRSLLRGLCDGGAWPIDCGILPTPAYYFARSRLGVFPGVMITASHSPPDHNGFKPILGRLPITPQELLTLRDIAQAGDFPHAAHGDVEDRPMRNDYVAWMIDMWRPVLLPNRVRLTVVLDCGNGSHCHTAPEVFQALGISHIPLFCNADGRFPNRSPDVSRPHALAVLAAAVRDNDADLGVAFDGDGDRVAFVDSCGEVVPSDVFVSLFARDVLQRHGPGPVVIDVKLSQAVEEVVRAAGGLPIRERSGHTFMKTRMMLTHAVLGGEMSGHVFFGDLDGGDDGLYAALAMIRLLTESSQSLRELAASIPRYANTGDIRLPFDGDSTALQEALAAHAAKSARVERLDGVKAHYKDGWALIRASVTESAITMRFEGRNVAALRRIVDTFLAPAPELRQQVLARENLE